MNPKYPIYIVSKARWESRLTSKSLERMKVPYYIVVEEQEYENYCNVIDESKVLILDKQFQKDYDIFDDDIGKGNGTGPGAARNFCWEHSISNGFAKHWVMYENVLISGFNYCKFCIASEKYPPFLFNTRIYSTLLIDNNCKYRWRGRYNEDTDLSIRVLKDGDCTLQYNAFLQEKATTQRLSGGNSKEFYDDEGTLNKSKMLEKMHPDIAKVSWRFNRWHHFVDYSQFKKNIPIKKKNLQIPTGVNNYGMVLKEVRV